MTDLIITWPNNCDYPLWREWLRAHRGMFGQVYIIFHDTHSNPNFAPFVRDAMWPDNVTIVTYEDVPSGKDWRDWGIHYALKDSKAEQVLFTEQDFFTTDHFWDKVRHYQEFDVVGVKDGTRLHPCFLLMKRETLEKTRKNFGIVPNVSDHFSLIQEDIEAIPNVTMAIIADYPEMFERLYHHMNGLSHNLRLMQEGQKVTYKPDEFRDYLRKTLTVSVPLSPVYVESVKTYLDTQ